MGMPSSESQMASSPKVQYRTDWATSLKLDENINVGGIDFTLIPAGEFLYGDSAVATHIDTGFYLSQTEVTVGQFAAFVESQQFRTVAETNNEGGWGQDPESRDTKAGFNRRHFTGTIWALNSSRKNTPRQAWLIPT